MGDSDLGSRNKLSWANCNPRTSRSPYRALRQMRRARYFSVLGRTPYNALSPEDSAPRAEGIPEGGNWAAAGDPDPGSSGGDIDPMAANTDLPFLTSDFNDAAAGTADVMGGNVVNLNAPPPPPGWAAFASP